MRGIRQLPPGAAVGGEVTWHTQVLLPLPSERRGQEDEPRRCPRVLSEPCREEAVRKQLPSAAVQAEMKQGSQLR